MSLPLLPEPIGECVGFHEVGFGEMPTIRWTGAYFPRIGDKFYAASGAAQPARDSGLREALAELVACKDMLDRLKRLHAMGHGTDYTDYYRREPLAWEAARAALAKQEAGSITAEPGFMAQIAEARANVAQWPQWMKDASRVATASLPLYAGTPPTKGPEDVPLSSGLESSRGEKT